MRRIENEVILMSINKEAIIELNKFLKGIRMGSEAFEIYQEKANQNDVSHQLITILTQFDEQEEKVISMIKRLEGNPDDSLGISGEMAIIFEKIKDIFVNTDTEILEHAIKALEMGITGGTNAVAACQEIKDHSDIAKELQDMVNHYRVMIKELESLKEQIK